MAGHAPQSLVAGDFNGDGTTDLAVANILSNDTSILLGRGLGEFSPPISLAVIYGPGSLAAGDFDNDGRPDLVVANVFSNNVSVLLNQSR